MLTIDTIIESFRDREARLASAADYAAYRHAAVALIVRDGADGPEIFYILRAHHDEDPWSGDIGFPGGHIETADGDARTAAERETLEETGIDLSEGRCLGRLDDIAGAHLSIIVSCLVYLLPAQEPPQLELNHEIHRAFWMPVRELLDPARRRLTEVRFGGETFRRPALDLLGPQQTVLWGITYRLTTQFLAINGHPLPATPIP